MDATRTLVCRCCGSRFHPPVWMTATRPACEWCRKVSSALVAARIARYGADHALPAETR